jgi:hypothetical protein
MGVDYYSCSCCNEALYEEFTDRCESCDERLCVDCLVNTDDVGRDGHYTYPFSNEDGEIESKFCPYCQGTEIDEHSFINFLCEKLGESREELEEKYLAGR